MQHTNVIQEEWWNLTAEASWGTAEHDVVAPRAENDALRRAPADRAVIDQACGMVMVLTPCRRGAARHLLVDVSRQRNVKLRDVAAALVAAWEGEPLSWPMQRALRRALRRLHAEDRRCDSGPSHEPFGKGRS